MNYKEIKVGEIFSSNNYGDFVIIKESNKRRYREKCYDIQFLKTNSIRYGICRKEILRGGSKRLLLSFDCWSWIFRGRDFTKKL